MWTFINTSSEGFKEEVMSLPSNLPLKIFS